MNTESDENRFAQFLVEWQNYATKTIRSRPSYLTEGFILTRLEVEVPFHILKFQTFEEFLSSLDVKTLFSDENVIHQARAIYELGSLDYIKYGDKVVCSFETKNQAAKGRIKWIGSVANIVCAGVELEKATGFGPFYYNGEVLFDVLRGHSKLVPLRELRKDDGSNSFLSKLSSNLSSALQTLEGTYSAVTKSSSRNGMVVQPLPRQTQPDNSPTPTTYPFSVDCLPNGLKVSDLVVWVTDNGNHEGILCWIGYLRSNIGLVAGVDFQRELGNTDGAFQGQRLFSCQPNHGRFIRISELVGIQDFYKNESSAATATETAQKDKSSDENMLVDLQEPGCLEPTDGVFQIGDLVTYRPNQNDRMNGIIRWKSSDDETDGSKIIYGIEFEKPTELKYGKVLPFSCRNGYGGLAPTSMLKKCNKEDPLSDSAKVNSQNDMPTTEVQGISAPVGPRVRFEELNVFIEPCIDANRWMRSLGFNQGIQGEDNSCYMDAVLFTLFAYTDAFDNLLLRDDVFQDRSIRNFKEILRVNIANQLRRNYFCPAERMKLLRNEIDKMSGNGTIRYGKMADVEEFLYVLFEAGLKLDNFLHYSNGVSDFIHQTIIHSKDQRQIITTQRLLENSMLADENIKMNRIPSPAFFMVMPRSDGKLVKYKYVVPSLKLDLTHLLADSARPCILCSTNLATNDCLECFDQIENAGVKSSAFCATCYELYHREESRQGHIKTTKSILYTVNEVASKRNIELQLLGIICFKSCHYVSFVKCGLDKSAPWVLHNSMVEYGSPEIKYVPGLSECLSSLENDSSKIQEDWDSYIPEVQQILQDNHICVYIPVIVEK